MAASKKTTAKKAAAKKPAAKKATTAKAAAAKRPAAKATTRTTTTTKPVAVTRLGVPKTYKLFIGGKYPRSESGRSFAVTGARGAFLANASLASRKDARDAVAAARKAFGGWSAATAYNRGQVLYRVAEMLDARSEQFTAELVASGMTRAAAAAEVDNAVAAWVYYAGFADKYAQVVGAANPVAAPYFNFSLPEPTGVVAIVAPQHADHSLVGLAATIAPVIVSGNTCVVYANEHNPLTAISFAEVLGTSDVPGGVVNILTGNTGEVIPILAAHMDVNGIDLAGLRHEEVREVEMLAAENLKRVVRPRTLNLRGGGDLESITRFIELKTVWHPIGV